MHVPPALWYSEFVSSGVDDIDIGNISLCGVNPDGTVACIKTENMATQLPDNQADGIKCLVPDSLTDDGNHRIRHCLAIANYLKLHYWLLNSQ